MPPPSDDLKNSVFDLAILVEDIEAIRKHLDLKSFIVMGHSGHAFMALEYAKKYSEYISGAVMIGVTPDYSNATHESADQFFERVGSPERKEAF